ncbi:MAG TPA: helix-turn-helix transcriptional regulator [Verrucomicrobiales bacterium]|nr:helix-turn-helix transcriptional regulator [Verrucomicrobiales bacterium]
MSPRKALGRNVSRLRHSAGMTQERLAEAVEIDRRYVQRIERGTANPGIDVLARMKSAFGCSWNELLDAT